MMWLITVCLSVLHRPPSLQPGDYEVQEQFFQQYSLWRCDVFESGPTAEAPFYKAVNIGYEPKAYELSTCESAASLTTDAYLGPRALD